MQRDLWCRGRAGAWLVIVGLAVGCSRRDHAPQHETPPERGGTLHVAVFEPIDYPTPILPIRPSTAQLLEHVTPPLGRFDEQGKLQALLAHRVQDWGDHLDFVLRPLRWEDGQPVTARDVALTARMMMDPRAHSGERARFDLVRDVTAPNDSTVRFEFAALTARHVLDALVMPLPAHALPESPDPAGLRDWPVTKRPLSCGPFRIATCTTGRLLLQRNDTSGFPPPWLDAVDFRLLEPDRALRDFRDGRLDVVDDVPAGQVRTIRNVKGAKIVALVGRSYVFMGWNLRDGRFSDPVVRRAAARAVNVREIIDELTEGQAEPARGPLVPALAYTDTTPVLAFDPRAAARALEDAGWHDEDRDGVRDRRGAHLAFHILVSDNDPLRLAIAARVSRDLARIGMAAEVRQLSVEELVPRLQSGAFEAFMGMWYPDPGLDLDPIWYSESTDRRNYGGYASTGADSLLARLRHEIDPGVRAQLLTDFQRRVYADQPYLFLVQNPRFVALSRRVRGADVQVLSTFWNLPRWWIPRDLQAEPAPSAADSAAS